MRIAVLIPSADYSKYAGARIRYGRIAPVLADRGIDLMLHDIADFRATEFDADILIISKCHDSRSLVAAAAMAERGCRVGVDLFDDYFSQTGDSRLARFRNWLTQILRHCRFGLCSTKAMARVIGEYRPELPVHVMNDPAADWQIERLPEILAFKRKQSLASRRLIVAWFGVGDNPNFPVGLHDLAAFGGKLRDLTMTGMDVALRVLTNARALTAEGLAELDQLPVRTTIDEWSEDRERALLEEAFAAFLPVNLQPFSAAKSLNRAVTALTAGCQVLSVGYPLYSQLDSLIYRDAELMLADLERDSLRLSAARIGIYRDAMESFASASKEGEKLIEFLSKVDAAEPSDGTLALIHGHGANGAAHKMVRALNGLSIASPYCTETLAFDVIFKGAPKGLSMFVSERAAQRLRPEISSKKYPAPIIGGAKFLEIADGERASAGELPIDWSASALPFQLATYGETMQEIRTRIAAAFGPCRTIVSETSQLPFPLWT